jgi:hypothetical protein
MKSEVPRLGSYSQQWRTTFAIPASFADSTCTGPRRTGAHSAQFGAFRVEFAGVCPVVSVFSVISPVLALYRLRFGMSGMVWDSLCARWRSENRECPHMPFISLCAGLFSQASACRLTRRPLPHSSAHLRTCVRSG